MSWHPEPDTLYGVWMDSRRDDDPADSGDYEGTFLVLSHRLDCGHTVSASEDSGGMDELPRVTFEMVELLLNWKIETHNCERFEAAERIRAEGRPFG